MLHFLRGEWGRPSLSGEYWTNLPRTLDVAVLVPWAVASSAWALAQIGQSAEAISRVRESELLIERQAARGIVGHAGWAYHAAGRAALMLGRVDDAWRLASRAVETCQRQPGFAAHALHLLGDIATHPDRIDAESGAAHYRQALALAELHGMRPLVAHCHKGLANLYGRTGNSEHARHHLVAATTMYREMEMDASLEQVLT
jgi:tetratricopeptide (TPR) repeat protein